MNSMSQISIFDLLPKPQVVDEAALLEERIRGFSLNEKIVARSRPYLVKYDAYAEIKQIASTRRNLFQYGRYEIWTYDEWTDKWDAAMGCYRGYLGKQLVFRIDNQIIAVTYLLENIYKDKIRFPAMCMAYMDGCGNKLPYTIRNNFIEEGLGITQHGTYRLGEIRKSTVFDFSSMETSLGKIIHYIKADKS